MTTTSIDCDAVIMLTVDLGISFPPCSLMHCRHLLIHSLTSTARSDHQKYFLMTFVDSSCGTCPFLPYLMRRCANPCYQLLCFLRNDNLAISVDPQLHSESFWTSTALSSSGMTCCAASISSALGQSN